MGLQKTFQYNLNEQTFTFILSFEKSVSSEKVFSNKKLVDIV